jgi:hypothetical protein
MDDIRCPHGKSYSQFCTVCASSGGEWVMQAAYSREEVEGMVRRGEISEQRGEELLRATTREPEQKPVS